MNAQSRPYLAWGLSVRRDLALVLVVVFVALALRAPVAFQSYWYDELGTLIHYVGAPWGKVVTSFSPNNHVLYTLCAKGLVDALDRSEFVMRLPSFVAGAGVGLALAWPMRRRRPGLVGFLVLLAGSFHPWLVAWSGEARGYALMILLCVVGTNLLPNDVGPRRRTEWLYPLVMAAAVYTIPLALILIAGHGVAVLLLRRAAIVRWAVLATVAGALVGALYIPLVRGAIGYYGEPHKALLAYDEFASQVFQSAWVGQRVGGLAFGVAGAALLVAGAVVAWRRDVLRAHLVAFGAAALVGLLLPLVMPVSAQVRFVGWVIVPAVLGAAALGAAMADALARAVRAQPLGELSAMGAVLAWTVSAAFPLMDTPPQPVREAVRTTYLDGAQVVGVHMCAIEAMFVYGGIDRIAYTAGELADAESKPLDGRVKPVVAIVFYEEFVRRDQPDLWDRLQARYRLVHRFPGRVSDVTIYLPKGLP